MHARVGPARLPWERVCVRIYIHVVVCGAHVRAAMWAVRWCLDKFPLSHGWRGPHSLQRAIATAALRPVMGVTRGMGVFYIVRCVVVRRVGHVCSYLASVVRLDACPDGARDVRFGLDDGAAGEAHDFWVLSFDDGDSNRADCACLDHFFPASLYVAALIEHQVFLPWASIEVDAGRGGCRL